ncbi:hypothetical protein DJ68_13910 [Halorubrum sp. C3]|nr:hypothetical protein DJ68_13910 [Halorubrum sp. C3]
MSDKHLYHKTEEMKIRLTIETLDVIGVQFEEIPDWMFTDGGWIYTEQLVMISIIKTLTESIKESIKNRQEGKEDSAKVAYMTELLWQIHDDQKYSELTTSETEY